MKLIKQKFWQYELISEPEDKSLFFNANVSLQLFENTARAQNIVFEIDGLKYYVNLSINAKHVNYPWMMFKLDPNDLLKKRIKLSENEIDMLVGVAQCFVDCINKKYPKYLHRVITILNALIQQAPNVKKLLACKTGNERIEIAKLLRANNAEIKGLNHSIRTFCDGQNKKNNLIVAKLSKSQQTIAKTSEPASQTNLLEM